jgi:predicted TIM-barrel fold metal-dependent hydrolase
VKQLVEAYGAKRLMWGSDFPFVVEECGYTNAANTLEELDVLSGEELEWVMGGTLASLFPSAWH